MDARAAVGALVAAITTLARPPPASDTLSYVRYLALMY